VQKDWPACVRFLEEGFRNGLRLDEVDSIRCFSCSRQRLAVFDTLLKSRRWAAQLASSYPAHRRAYLARLNAPLRLFMDSLYVEEQLTKNNRTIPPAGEQYLFREGRWDRVYDSLLRTVGYPGERLVGVDDNAVCRALGFPGKDAIDIFRRKYARRAQDYHVTEDIFDMRFYYTAQITMVPVIHHSCLLSIIRKHAAAQIAAGNLHPREVALVLDFFTTPDARPRKCNYAPAERFALREPLDSIERPTINSAANRARGLIVPHEVDAAKRSYARAHGLQLYFGFMFML